MAETCEALRTGRVGELPVKRKTVSVKERKLIYLYLRCDGRTAIHQRGAGDIWQGLWEPVLLDASQVRPVYELRAQRVKHVLTHRVLYADQYALPLLVEKLIAML